MKIKMTLYSFPTAPGYAIYFNSNKSWVVYGHSFNNFSKEYIRKLKTIND